ncbi:MAG: tRNA glutamyl-Q(34) synthetase GluQRS [Halioglobus sp.]|nr:tRNA glutamyl-Q(34) synthetase GluQRS [Halioglobus sp.]
MSGSDLAYRGRFAPSPTGPLHLGSLVAALASYLDARHCSGSWLVRMDDLDPPREEPGAADNILHSLQCHGLHWDEHILYQRTRTAAYNAALANLADRNHLFHCDCTRAILSISGACDSDCKTSQTKISGPAATRIRVPFEQEIVFKDRLQRQEHTLLGQSLENFVVKRKDNLFAYQLAVVVDDAEQGITHVVRGSDLLASTPRQIFLQQCLLYPTPRYCHVPVITTSQGQKFSKQNHAPALDNSMPRSNLLSALRLLHQREPPAMLSSVGQLLAFAVEHWSLEQVPAISSIPAAKIGVSA